MMPALKGGKRVCVEWTEMQCHTPLQSENRVCVCVFLERRGGGCVSDSDAMPYPPWKVKKTRACVSLFLERRGWVCFLREAGKGGWREGRSNTLPPNSISCTHMEKKHISIPCVMAYYTLMMVPTRPGLPAVLYHIT